METINKQALRDLREAGMERDQAEAVASHIPDWTQFATKDDIRVIHLSIRELRAELKLELGHMEKRLIRWIVLLLVVPVLLTLASGVINQFF